MDFIDGLKKVLSNLNGVSPAVVEQVSIATEKTAVLVANHAKRDHSRGFAHAVGRYENRTTNLTNSIMPELIRADKQEVQAVVQTNKEYAPRVEYGSGKSKAYPFMHPAMMSQKDGFKKRVERAIHGNV